MNYLLLNFIRVKFKIISKRILRIFEQLISHYKIIHSLYMTVITLGELLDAGVHFGHQSSRWNPKMFPYIYQEQNGVHVIDLVQTARLLTYAYNYVQNAAKENKTFFIHWY